MINVHEFLFVYDMDINRNFPYLLDGLCLDPLDTSLSTHVLAKDKHEIIPENVIKPTI